MSNSNIDGGGNLTLNRASTFTLEIFKQDETTGAAIDISSADLLFTIRNGFAVAPIAHPTISTARLLQITPAQIQSLTVTHAPFLLQQRNGVSDHQTLWSGVATIEGFAA
jgi:hypothetical protein